MMKRVNIVITALLLGLLAACNLTSNQPCLDAELGKPRFDIKDSDDPVDHKIYEIMRNTGIQVVYEYLERDYLWNLGAAASPRFDTLIKVKERPDLAATLDYLDKALLSHYPESFLRKYVPVYIFVADSVYNTSRKRLFPAYLGRNYLAVGDCDAERLATFTPAQLKERRGILNGLVWEFITSHALVEMPDEFFKPSEEYYEMRVKQSDDKEFDARKYGFWTTDLTAMKYTDDMGPDRATDVNHFVKAITSMSQTEIEQAMTGFPLMQAKYNVLTGFVRNELGIDLQAIGNK